MPHSVGGMMECGLHADDPAQSLLDSICSVNAHFPPFPKLHFQETSWNFPLIFGAVSDTIYIIRSGPMFVVITLKWCSPRKKQINKQKPHDLILTTMLQ